MSDELRHIEVGRELRRGEVPEDPLAFLRALGGPALLRLPGRDRSRTRIVSVLLHGNEPSGLLAVQRWLRTGRESATDAVVLISAVEAALEPPGFARRWATGGSDLNRCWLPPFDGVAGRLASRVLSYLESLGAESLVDLHNNSGHSPPYGVGPHPGSREIGLVSLFGSAFVHSPLRLGTLVEATRALFPSVTVECGRSGDPAADAVALAGLERYLAGEPGDADVRVLVDPVRVRLQPGVDLAFGDGPHPGLDLTIDRRIDRHNFETLPAGVPIGWLAPGAPWPLLATGADGRDRSRDLFTSRAGLLETRRSIVPIMMTSDRESALADCLFYVVQRSEIESTGAVE